MATQQKGLEANEHLGLIRLIDSKNSPYLAMFCNKIAEEIKKRGYWIKKSKRAIKGTEEFVDWVVREVEFAINDNKQTYVCIISMDYDENAAIELRRKIREKISADIKVLLCTLTVTQDT